MESIIKKYLIVKTNWFLLAIVLILSAFQQTEFCNNNKIIKNPILILTTLIYSYFILLRIKNKILLNKIEWLQLLIVICGIFSGLFLIKYKSINIEKPLEYGLVFFGISSFILIHDIKDNFIFFIFKMIIILAFIHYFSQLIMIYNSGNALFYNTSQDYINNAWHGLFGNSPKFSWVMMIGTATASSLFFLYLLRKNYPAAFFYFFLTMIISTGLLFSASRNAIVSAGIYISLSVLYIIINKKFFQIESKVYYMFLIIITAFILFLFFTGIIELVIYKTLQQGTSQRTKYWSIFFDTEKGIFPSLKFFLGRGYYYNLSFTDRANHAHNSFMFVLAQYGLIGLILFLSQLVIVLKKNFRMMKQYWYLNFIAIAILFLTSFDTILVRKSIRLEPVLFYFALLIPYYKGEIENKLNN